MKKMKDKKKESEIFVDKMIKQIVKKQEPFIRKKY